MLAEIAGGLRLVATLDLRLWEIVALSLLVSLSAVVLATAVGLPLGAAVAVGRFPGRRAVIVLLNALMGLPPVVVGLVVYLLLSRAGPLGELGLLFTPAAMVVAQTVLITPIIAALARQAIERGFDMDLPKEKRRWLYMPFMHSEDLADQEKSVELFERSEISGSLPFAVEHADIILASTEDLDLLFDRLQALEHQFGIGNDGSVERLGAEVRERPPDVA